jgi:hypothetical protein
LPLLRYCRQTIKRIRLPPSHRMNRQKPRMSFF